MSRTIILRVRSRRVIVPLVIVNAVVDAPLSPDFSPGDALEVFIHRAAPSATPAGMATSTSRIFSTPDGFWALPVAEAARRARAAVQAL